MAGLQRSRLALACALQCGGRTATCRVAGKVQETAAPRCMMSARAFSQAAGQQWWDRHIHIPDLPLWGLVVGGAGVGGLFYYYSFYKHGHHARVEPYTGPGYTRDYKGTVPVTADLPVVAAAAPLPTVTLPPFKATDVAKGTPVTPDDLENVAVLLVFVDPTSPAALDGLERLQEVTGGAGGSSRIPLQPVAVDMASEEPAEHSQLARLLTDLQSRGKSRVDPEMPLIRGLAGQDAARKIRDSVQHFAGDPAAKGAAVKPEAVTEEGVLHLFGPDGLLVIQYDATVLPKDVAEDVMRRLQEYEKRSPAKRSAK